MVKRICGTHDDTITTKKILVQKYNNSKVPDDGNTIYVGIVFHICFKNFNKAEVEADVSHTIELMNKDFNKQTSNFNNGSNVYSDPSLKETYQQYLSLAQGCNIQFYQVDILYASLDVQSSSNTSVLDRNIKGASPAVESNKYLNIWVADLSSGLLGYAQFPWDNSPTTDGVVIAKGTFGRNPTYEQFDLNKTLTHECGHWFGLYHTFQETFAYGGGNINYIDGTSQQEAQEMKGDCVVDTPPQAEPTYGNPFETPTSWPTSKPIDEKQAYRHMFMDFMDYSDDIALFMFTKDQANKIRQMVHIYRPDILKNNPNEPTPAPAPSQPEFTYNFETTAVGPWVRGLKLYNNNTAGTNAQVTTMSPHSGSKCLRTKSTARGELVGNFTGLKNLALSLYIKASNPYTYIWVKPPTSTTWYYAQIPVLSSYKQYTFNLPGPYDSIGSTHYAIRFGTNGRTTYSYFDDIVVASSSDLKFDPDSYVALTNTPTDLINTEKIIETSKNIFSEINEFAFGVFNNIFSVNHNN